jgi:hypothetical protein
MSARRTYSPWTTAEEETLRQMYEGDGRDTADCARALGRPNDSVKGKIQSLGLRKAYVKPTPGVIPDAVDPIEAERERQARARQLQQEREALREVAGEKSLRASIDRLFREIAPRLAPAPSYRPVKRTGKDTTRETLLLHLSDWHYGERVAAESTRGFNAYDTDTAAARVRSIVAGAVGIADKMRAGGGWQFPRLVVALNGDIVTGTIHELERHSDPENIIWSTYGAGLLVADAVRTLAGSFEQVDVYCTSGNHGRLPDARRMQSKDPTRNWDTVVALFAKTALADCKNVTVEIPNSYAVSYEVEGTTVLQSHGHDIKSWSGIPWYGISRFLGNYNGMEAARGGRIGAYLFGHFHSQTNITYPGGEAFVNGSLIGGTEWTVGTLGKADRPCQMMLAFHPEHGVTHRWPIYASDE